jgi:hypothetical protein
MKMLWIGVLLRQSDGYGFLQPYAGFVRFLQGHSPIALVNLPFNAGLNGFVGLS